MSDTNNNLPPMQVENDDDDEFMAMINEGQ